METLGKPLKFKVMALLYVDVGTIKDEYSLVLVILTGEQLSGNWSNMVQA